jgi:hypothetical protein
MGFQLHLIHATWRIRRVYLREAWRNDVWPKRIFLDLVSLKFKSCVAFSCACFCVGRCNETTIDVGNGNLWILRVLINSLWILLDFSFWPTKSSELFLVLFFFRRNLSWPLVFESSVYQRLNSIVDTFQSITWAAVRLLCYEMSVLACCEVIVSFIDFCFCRFTHLCFPVVFSLIGGLFKLRPASVRPSRENLQSMCSHEAFSFWTLDVTFVFFFLFLAQAVQFFYRVRKAVTRCGLSCVTW